MSHAVLKIFRFCLKVISVFGSSLFVFLLLVVRILEPALVVKMPDFVLAGLEDRHVVVDHGVLEARRLQLEKLQQNDSNIDFNKVIVKLTSTK